MGLFGRLKKGYLKTAIEFEEKAASKRLAKAQARDFEARENKALEKKYAELKATGRTSPVQKPRSNNSSNFLGALEDVGGVAAGMLESQEKVLYGTTSKKGNKKESGGVDYSALFGR